jgi:crossover junction endodeoxyribonuclease RuvC
MRIIAFDSGLERTGWAVFDKNGSDNPLLKYGCIFTSKNQKIHERIYALTCEVQKLIDEYKPEAFVLEQLFFLVNKKTAIQVAQAQGAVLGLAGKHSITIDFLTPTQIKQSLTGYGLSDKKNVQKMIQMLLHLDPLPTPDDTVDAIACGLTYCTMMKSL